MEEIQEEIQWVEEIQIEYNCRGDQESKERKAFLCKYYFYLNYTEKANT